MTDIDIETALALLHEGLAVIPTAGGGEKRPFGKWKDYQSRLPGEDEVRAWFATPRPGGIVCGAVSGGLEVIDLDTPAAFDRFRAAWSATVPCEASPHGGHAWYRCDAAGRNARPAEKVDLRGEGGFCVVYDPALLLKGGVPRVDAAARARMLAGVRAPTPPAVPPGVTPPNATLRGGLVSAGWKSLGVRADGREHFSRPGAAHPARTDATLSADGQHFTVFSTAAQEAPAPTPLDARPLADFLQRAPALPPEIVEGLVRKGEVVMLCGSPKAGKSLLASQLALCVAAGLPFLGRRVTQGAVLLVDLELPPAVLAHRLAAQARRLEAPACEALRVVSERGRIPPLADIAATAEAAPPALLVLDGLYRLLDQEGVDENANAQVAAFMARLGALAERVGCAILLTHHRKKGPPAARTADEAVGAGAFGRSVDSLHCLLEKDGGWRLASVLRSFPAARPLPVRRVGALWAAA